MKRFLIRLLRTLAAVVLVAVFAVTLCRLVVILKTKDRVRTDAEALEESASGPQYEAIIVLGAGVLPARSPTPILERRLKKAVELYRKGLSKQIIVTGDHRPGEYDEVDVMWEYLIVANVPEDAIQRDYQGFSTYESMVRMANVYGLGRSAVITQEYHLYRAMFVAASYGVDIRGIAAEDVGDTLVKLSRLGREWIASVKDLCYTVIRKEIPQ